jgi:hypothetical protein
MKKEQENKQAEEWVTPSIDVIDINNGTMNGEHIDHDDIVFFS